MLSNIGFPGLILILIIALIVFGPSKLPEIGRAFGKTLKEFKSATKGLTDDEEETQAHKTEAKPVNSAPEAHLDTHEPIQNAK